VVNNDAVFVRPSAGEKPDGREWRTCRECGKVYPLEHFPLQSQPQQRRGSRMQVCTYCRNKGLAGKPEVAIDWYAIPLRAEYYLDAPPPSLAQRLRARAALRGSGAALLPLDTPEGAQ
jgi:hypothetical protein